MRSCFVRMHPSCPCTQSWVYGKAMQVVEPAAVALHSSRGYESPTSKLAMRVSVMLLDLVCLFPAALACAAVFGGRDRQHQLVVLAALLFCPALLLIDHGHFQFNGVGLGLAAGAVAAIADDRDALGSVLFCLSLNHKHMALYYAPAFFAHLLGKCLQRPTLVGKVCLQEFCSRLCTPCATRIPLELVRSCILAAGGCRGKAGACGHSHVCCRVGTAGGGWRCA